MEDMRTRKVLQILILAAALDIGISQPIFNGLSLLALLALLALPTVFLLQPGALLTFRRPVLRLVK
ncbi:hypothetical protein [Arthrobacter oryzae]|uniref:hypothetical protein n=1 Tax=Arthrobacter oryzae TaxID=409290 RepID=UPI0028546F4F|nr:hypothetical protein [Arthrobacter oryzae]MDR6508514.1 hypothetical protein [Arthrobacter oryzae]